MNNMNVIIADDHPIVLFGIRKSLEQIEWVNVVGEFEDSTALINNLPKLDAHVLITDLSMPGDKYGDGITLIKYIKRHFPSLSIIVLTMNNNPAILSAVQLFSDLSHQETFRKQAQNFTLFWRETLVTVTTSTDFFQQARNAFRGKFLPFLQRGESFRQIGRCTLFQHDPFDIQIQYRTSFAGIPTPVSRTRIER